MNPEHHCQFSLINCKKKHSLQIVKKKYNFSPFVSIFDYILLILHKCIWVEFTIRGRMHQLYKIFFGSYSDLYYKTKSLRNLLITGIIIISIIITWLLITIVYMYGPSLLCADFVKCRVDPIQF